MQQSHGTTQGTYAFVGTREFARETRFESNLHARRIRKAFKVVLEGGGSFRG